MRKRRNRPGDGIFELFRLLAALFVLWVALAASKSAANAKPVDVVRQMFQPALGLITVLFVVGLLVLVTKFILHCRRTGAWPLPARSDRFDPAASPLRPAGPAASQPPLSAPRIIDMSVVLPEEAPPPSTPTLTDNRPFDWAQTIENLDWYQFEKLVALLLSNQGWQVERRGGANADGGIDLIARMPGRDDLAVQCKHWKAWNLGVARVREFLGALMHARLKAGLIIATKGYTDQAEELARQHNIRLMDQSGLIRLLEETGSRFAPEVRALLQDPTKHCPKCEAPMILRQSATPFWGCSRYPACRGKMPA